jgi:hypothetical protein
MSDGGLALPPIMSWGEANWKPKIGRAISLSWLLLFE